MPKLEQLPELIPSMDVFQEKPQPLTPPEVLASEAKKISRKDKSSSKKKAKIENAELPELIPEPIVETPPEPKPEWPKEKVLKGIHIQSVHQYHDALSEALSTLNSRKRNLFSIILGKKARLTPEEQEIMLKLKYKSEVTAENLLDEVFQHALEVNGGDKNAAEAEVKKVNKEIAKIRSKRLIAGGLTETDLGQIEERIFDGIQMPTSYHEADRVYADYVANVRAKEEEEKKRIEEMLEIGSFRSIDAGNGQTEVNNGEEAEVKVINAHITLEELYKRAENAELRADVLNEQNKTNTFSAAIKAKGSYGKMRLDVKVSLAVILASGGLTIGEFIAPGFTGRLASKASELLSDKNKEKEVKSVEIATIEPPFVMEDQTKPEIETPVSVEEKEEVVNIPIEIEKEEKIEDQPTIELDTLIIDKGLPTEKISAIENEKIRNLVEFKFGVDNDEGWKNVSELDAAKIFSTKTPKSIEKNFSTLPPLDYSSVKSLIEGTVEETKAKPSKGEKVYDYLLRVVK